MKRSLLSLPAILLALVFCSCSKPKTPEQVAATFIQNLHAREFDKASALTAAASRPAIEKGRAENLPTNSPVTNTPEALFSTATLKAKSNATESIVENDQISLNLVKEEGEWRVQATPEVVQSILNRNQFVEDARMAWKNLQEEYEKRNEVIAEYLRSVNNRNSDLVQLLAAAKAADPNQKELFVAKQDAMQVVLDRNFQPTMTASSDLSLNYVIQIANAADRIKAAREAYNAAAVKARTKEFVILK